jgi:tRNA A-37 threonylcarbamoyl transferase component Bud32
MSTVQRKTKSSSKEVKKEQKSNRSKRQSKVLDCPAAVMNTEKNEAKVNSNKYQIISKLGQPGQQGRAFIVKTKRGKEYAMKVFKKTKSSKNIKLEVTLQNKAAKAGVAPRIVDYDLEKKFIVMEKMDDHLYNHLLQNKKRLLKAQQDRIFHIFQTLDKVKVFHNDANLYNYMTKDGQIYLIDYGLSKRINSHLVEKVQTELPNSRLMLIGFILKLKEWQVPSSSYKYLLQHVDKSDLEKFHLLI